MTPTLTAHMIVKNDECFAPYAVRSVIDFIDQVIVFDTGSTDGTIAALENIQHEYPEKVIIEHKGDADKARHTALRNEMIAKTETDWIMILDGDEVWTNRGILELKTRIAVTQKNAIVVPFYLCVGDIYHYSKKGHFLFGEELIHATVRAFRNSAGVHWSGEYGLDKILDGKGNDVFSKNYADSIQNRFWHMTHLKRSSNDSGYSSGSINRRDKQVPTHLYIGVPIMELPPKVLLKTYKKMSYIQAVINIVIWSIRKLTKSFGNMQKI